MAAQKALAEDWGFRSFNDALRSWIATVAIVEVGYVGEWEEYTHELMARDYLNELARRSPDYGAEVVEREVAIWDERFRAATVVEAACGCRELRSGFSPEARSRLYLDTPCMPRVSRLRIPILLDARARIPDCLELGNVDGLAARRVSVGLEEQPATQRFCHRARKHRRRKRAYRVRSRRRHLRR